MGFPSLPQDGCPGHETALRNEMTLIQNGSSEFLQSDAAQSIVDVRGVGTAQSGGSKSRRWLITTEAVRGSTSFRLSGLLRTWFYPMVTNPGLHQSRPHQSNAQSCTSAWVLPSSKGGSPCW